MEERYSFDDIYNYFSHSSWRNCLSHNSVFRRIEVKKMSKTSDSGQEKIVQCPLCGCKFDLKEATKACETCPFSKKCNLIMCPKCHYEFSKP